MTLVRTGLDVEQAQKVVDYVADRLVGADFETAERLLDAFVDRLRRLDDVAAAKRAIAESDAAALDALGGIEEAKNLIELIGRITRA